MTATLQELLDSPRLATLAETIDHALADERQRRQQFANSLRDDEKAEFINGKVVQHVPTKNKHVQVVTDLTTLLNIHVRLHDLGFVGVEKLFVRLTRNDYMPDIVFFKRSRNIGQDPRQEYHPAPDFVVEVLSPSTAHVDRVTKFQDYADHQVTEYWIVDPEAETIEQNLLREEKGERFYGSRAPARDGEVASVAVPGFTIPVRALFDPAEHATTMRRLVLGG